MTTSVGVTVLLTMPCYNQAKWLRAALASVAAQGVPHRLVCVDDGSSDETPKILKVSGHEVVTHPKNQGSAAAINTGIERLSRLPTKEGSTVAYSWISSDNEMHPDWLRTLAPMIGRGAGAAYGGFQIIKHPEMISRDRYGRPRHRPCLFKQHQKDLLIDKVSCYYGPAFLIRADVWKEAGPHRGGTAHDFDHWLRVEEACWRMKLPIVGVDRPLCSYNAHDQSVSATRGTESDALHWKAVALERRAIKCP